MSTIEEKRKAQRDRRIQKLMQDCKHFRGVQNENCAAGVNIRQLVGGPDLGWACRMPCLPSIDRETITTTCDKFCALTADEAELRMQMDEAASARHMQAFRAAHDDAKTRGLGKGKGGNGDVKCPICPDGKIQYSVASYNGHMHARCTTKDCVMWME